MIALFTMIARIGTFGGKYSLNVWLLLLTFSGTAAAHVGGNAYLKLNAQADNQWQGVLELPLVDLDRAMRLDSNADGNITWGELRSRHTEIRQAIVATLSLRGSNTDTEKDATDCVLTIGTAQVDEHEGLGYSVWPFTTTCPGNIMSIDYRMLRGLDAGHRLHVVVQHNDKTISRLINPSQPPTTLHLTESSTWGNIIEYVWEGIWHILIGYDHILFLLALLIVAVYHQRQPVRRRRTAIINVVKIATAFTLGHSITLVLATFKIILLPIEWVETGIALSIVIVALYGMATLSAERRWRYAFAFGLLHGFGFASVLGELSLPQADFAIALVAFNVGVELGQLALIAVFMPVALMLRHTTFYRIGVVYVGSVAITLLALYWAWERVPL